MSAPSCPHGVPVSEPCEACAITFLHWLGPDDGLPPGEDDQARFGGRDEKLAQLVADCVRDALELRDVPQEPFVFDMPMMLTNEEIDALLDMPTVAAAIAAMAPEQRQKLCREWRAGSQCQQLIQDMAAGNIEFGDALEVAVLAGIEAAVKA